ncbi:MAG TPA: hypothetical protein VD886_18595 [Herpetosiphonaceae bacterium]|nr:hypothetical protein [Herpetosiphonaceae bacterium]
MTYRLTTSGRWLLLSFVAATLLVWLFAVWLFADTLGLSFANLAESWRAARPKWTSGQLVPAWLLATLAIAAPLLVWHLLGEWSASYTLEDDGLRFRALGVNLLQPWGRIRGIRTINERGEDQARIDILVDEPARPTLRRRFFHRLAPGRIPIYGLVANREALVAAIQEKIALEKPAGER